MLHSIGCEKRSCGNINTNSKELKRYLLLGWPVRHSVSPEMQQAGFQAAGLRAAYELLPVPPDKLASEIKRIRDAGYAGWNVTVPHKEAVLPFLNQIDPAAAAAGSVNTVINQDGRLLGYSTDGYGLERAILEGFSTKLENSCIVFAGTGGAARACSIYFALRGVRKLVLANRTLARAQAIATVIQAHAGCEVVCLELNDSRMLKEQLAGADVLVQSTSLGLHAADALPLDPDLLSPDTAVYDMIYRETPFQTAARRRGCKTVDGRGMLLYQGVKSFELWTGVEAPVTVMRKALAEALAARDRAATPPEVKES